MCGIFGWIDTRASRLDQAIAATHVLGHRGPDDWGMVALLPRDMCRSQGASGWDRRVDVRPVTRGYSVIFGHRRLSIIDLSEAGRQPMTDPDSGALITYNGEVYNYQELRDDLAACGLAFRSRTDTEAIVLGYRVWGVDVVNRLRGMFAFAIWDPTGERLVLARDRIGKKPLFYYHKDGCFAFASELKALLAVSSVDRRINPSAVHDYLTFGYVPGDQTIFDGIRKVPPGHHLVWQHGKVSIEPYWTIDDWFDAAHEGLVDEGAWRDETARRLADCVRMRLVGDVPVGAFLSGGIDSSAIVALMARECGPGLKTFSIGFRERSFDELRYARLIAERFTTDHHELVVEPRAADVLGDLVWYLDEPFADPSVLPTFLLSRFAREHVKVVLTGDGGDEVFAGYESYQGEQYVRLYEKAPAMVRHGLEALLSKAPESSKRTAVLRRAKRFVEKAALPREYREWRIVFPQAAKQTLYSESLKAATGMTDCLQRRARAFEAANRFDWIVALQLWDFHVYLPDDLMVKTDRTTMANGLEARSPFLDHRLIEWSGGMPSRLKVRGWRTKHVLKEAVTSLLPAEIINRPKQGFAVPVAAWFRGELRDMARDTLLSARCVGRGYFQPEAVDGLLRAHAQGVADHGHKLWVLLNLELWHRRFVDQAPQATAYAEAAQSA